MSRCVARALARAKTMTAAKRQASQQPELLESIQRFGQSSDERDLDIIRSMLLRKGTDVDCQGLDGETPLFHAVIDQSLCLVQMLLDAGARVNLRDLVDFETPLLIAVGKSAERHPKLNDFDIIRALLKHGADPNIPNKFGTTPILRAIERWCSSNVLEALLKGGADPNQTDVKTGNTPLYAAIFVENGAAVKLLLEHGADTDVCNGEALSPLELAVKGRYSSGVVEILLQHGASVDRLSKSSKARTPLYSAVASGNLKATCVLLSHGADLFWTDGAGTSPFSLAVRSASVDLIFEVLRSKPDQWCLSPRQVFDLHHSS